VQDFEPVSAAGLAEVTVVWTSDLFGTSIDPTGQTALQPVLPVLMAFPVSSGNPLAPAPAVTWYAAAWLLGTTAKGYAAQALVGPGGVVTLTAGTLYDVWSEVEGTEIPKVFAGSLAVY
jgi:hypothetical protein